LKRREREEDRFWQLFRPIFDFSLAVKGLKEEDRHRAIQVDEVMQTLCEGISIRGDGKSERLLFDSKSYLQASQYVAKMKDNSEIIRSYHLAQLFRAIRIGDYENIRGALTRGARLDWPSACLGREPLLYAVRKGDETIVAILLTYGEYRDPRNRPRKLVSAMQLAAQLRNTRMMQLLLDHPLGIRQSSIHISSAEQDSDKNYARPVRWRRDVPERDEELHRIHKPPLLQQALNTVLIESIQCSDSDLFDFTINLNREAEEDMAKRALLQAIKTSNVTMATHIINSRIGSMIDLNAEEDYTPSILYTAITQKQHRSARVDLTRLLISHGADPNQKSWTPGFLRYDFHYQHNLRVLNHVEGDRHDLFKVLVESGARIEECKIENFVGQMINIFLLDEFGQVDWVKAALEKAAQESK
jgi:ankyrin repeat protein